MEQHAIELLHAAVWLLGVMGGLIIVLLGAIAAFAKWGGAKLFERLAEQDLKMEQFQRTVATVGDEIKSLLTSETRLLRESQYEQGKEIVKLSEFREMVLRSPVFGRRWEDQNHNGSD